MTADWLRKFDEPIPASGALILHRIAAMIEDAGLKVRFYGRLKGWDGQSPIWRDLMRDG